MSSTPFDRERCVAEHAARQAGQLLVEAFGHVTARLKGPGDLLTDADLASQSLINRILREAFPGHTVLAEEDGLPVEPDNPARWIVDPLDGTINFAHGLPIWCVSIGFEWKGELVVGVIYLPLLNALYAASKGQGATLNQQPIRVSSASMLKDSLIATGMPTNFEADADRLMALMRRFSTGTHSVRRTGSSAWNLALVAAGAVDVCYATALNPWDAAAGVVIVREAGGTVSGLQGQPYNLYDPQILATNGLVHREAIDTIADAWQAG
jgi:myo-inositol-1(or 4)-monophosphatase